MYVSIFHVDTRIKYNTIFEADDKYIKHVISINTLSAHKLQYFKFVYFIWSSHVVRAQNHLKEKRNKSFQSTSHI